MSFEFTIIYDLEYTAQINRTDRNLDHAKTPVIMTTLAQFLDRSNQMLSFFIRSLIAKLLSKGNKKPFKTKTKFQESIVLHINSEILSSANVRKHSSSLPILIIIGTNSGSMA